MKVIIYLLVIGVGIACSEKPEPDVVAKKTPPAKPLSIEEQIDVIASSNDLPSFAVAVVSDDTILWQHFYGMADEINQVDANKETIYSVASISKLVTATAIMQQIEAGNIDIDADINTYLDFDVRNPSFSDEPISVRMLLTHRSGLSAPSSTGDPNFYVPFEAETAPELGSWLQGYLMRSVAWTLNAPGSAEQYSNHGAAILGYVVERVTGVDFREYCKQHIFIPLGMTNTSFDLTDLEPSKLATIEHSASHFQYSVPYYPATTLKTSIDDFSRFARMYLNGGSLGTVEVLKPESVDELLAIKNSGSSLGFLWWSYSGGWNGHAGAYYGATSFMDINKNRQKGVIMFINKTQWLMTDTGLIWPGGLMHDLVHRYALSL